MKILGFRSTPKLVRFALVDWDGTKATLLNASSDNRLVYPAGSKAIEQHLLWLWAEIDRILYQHSDVSKVVVKVSEYGKSESKSSRATAYSDALILLACAKANIPVRTKVYASLKTKSANVLSFANMNVGKTSVYWDKPMADAVAAAWSERS